MEWIQPFLVFLAALSALAFLVYKGMPKSKSNKGGSCYTNCGCH